MIVIGLTGSIGMGKSTVGAMLEVLGVPVHEADATVHSLLRPSSPAWAAFAAAFPHFEYSGIYRRKRSWVQWLRLFPQWEYSIDRAALGRVIFADEAARRRLESILHPFVQKAQQTFIRRQKALGRHIVALDIPLLFETGAENRVDYTIVVTAPPYIQHARVMARPGMSAEKLEGILKRQMPNDEKCARADFVVHSGLGRAYMMRELKSVLHTISEKRSRREERSTGKNGRSERNCARYRNHRHGPGTG